LLPPGLATDFQCHGRPAKGRCQRTSPKQKVSEASHRTQSGKGGRSNKEGGIQKEKRRRRESNHGITALQGRCLNRLATPPRKGPQKDRGPSLFYSISAIKGRGRHQRTAQANTRRVAWIASRSGRLVGTSETHL